MTAVIEPRTLQDIQGTLAQRRAEQKALLDKYPDISGDEVKEIQRLDQELNDLHDRGEQLRQVERIRGDAAKWDEQRAEAKAEDAAPAAGAALVDRILGSAAFKDWRRGMRQGPTVELPLADGELGSKATLTTVGMPPESTRIARIVPGALRRPMVASLMPQGTTNQAAVKYLEETTTTNGVAPVLEGGTKPESTLAFTERTAPLRKIAGILKVTDETLEDEPLARSYLESRLLLFLALAEENQLINGDNVAPNTQGLLNASTLTEALGAAPDAVPDAFYRAMTKVRVNSFLEPNGHIINPEDWAAVRLMKTSDGLYVWGHPAEAGPERLWGLPVVITTAITAGTGQTGAYDTATMLVRKPVVAFEIATQNEDDWRKNIVAMRVESRIALLVFRPNALCDVTGI